MEKIIRGTDRIALFAFALQHFGSCSTSWPIVVGTSGSPTHFKEVAHLGGALLLDRTHLVGKKYCANGLDEQCLLYGGSVSAQLAGSRRRNARKSLLFPKSLAFLGDARSPEGT